MLVERLKKRPDPALEKIEKIERLLKKSYDSDYYSLRKEIKKIIDSGKI